MVVAERVPCRSADGAAAIDVSVKGTDIVRGTIVLHVHLTVAVSGAVSAAVGVEGVGNAAERVTTRITRGGALAELTRFPRGVIFFEGRREVDLEAAPLGVGVEAAGDHRQAGPGLAGDGRRSGFGEDRSIEEVKVVELGGTAINPAEGDILEPFQDFDAGPGGAA